ncbi:hypothetical protein [Duganella sp. S19_KUP01_CR8]|uniref:hypothetical protein n=1 Tax=Duganella sp. S19_KUP01_CR8 TaxID=3025502 RepID=UPI002FCD9EBE
MTIQKYLIAVLSATGVLTLAACGGGGEIFPNPYKLPDKGTPVASTVTIDFNTGIDGWRADVADYTDKDRPTEVASGWKDLPAPLSGKGYYLVSHNNSDDVLTYATRQLEGFIPTTKYAVTFEMRYATDAATGCMGVGGSRGESVWMVVAANYYNINTVEQPGGHFRMNLDRGNQAVSGTQGKVLGTQGVAGLDCAGGKWVSTTRKSSEAIEVTTDKDGRFWIALGADSGFEGTNAFYLQGATINIKPL